MGAVADLTATHFSFLATAASLSESSSSDVTLSSVSASTPVVFSDSELEDSLVVSVVVGAAASMGVEAVEVSVLDEVAASRAFFALRASLRSDFYEQDWLVR